MSKYKIDRYAECEHCGQAIGFAIWLQRWVHMAGLKPECTWTAEPRKPHQNPVSSRGAG